MTPDNLPEKKEPGWAKEVWDRAKYPLIKATGAGLGAATGYGVPKLYNALAKEKGWGQIKAPDFTHAAAFSLIMGLGIEGAAALKRRAVEQHQLAEQEKEQAG